MFIGVRTHAGNTIVIYVLSGAGEIWNGCGASAKSRKKLHITERGSLGDMGRARRWDEFTDDLLSYPAADGASVDVARRLAMRSINGTIRSAVEERMYSGLL